VNSTSGRKRLGGEAFYDGSITHVRIRFPVATMDWDDYLRQQAVMYQLAAMSEDAVNKQELLDLAAVCEEVANNIEDRASSG
jgi:hypothetical protein